MSTGLKVGIIGIGWHAAMNHVPQLRATGRAEVIAIARRNPELLQLAKEALAVPAAYTDWRELLQQADLDAVVIATPHDAHLEPCVSALEHGLHVLVEKPIALTAPEAHQMVRCARDANRVLMVGFNARANAKWRALKQLLDEGTLGTVRQLRASCSGDTRVFWQAQGLSEGVKALTESSDFLKGLSRDLVGEGNWRSSIERSGGGFTDIGSHFLDLLLWLADSNPAVVSAFQQRIAGTPASIMDVQASLVSGAGVSFSFNNSVSGGDFKFYGHSNVVIAADRGVVMASWEGLDPAAVDDIRIERDGEAIRLAAGDSISPAAAFIATVLDNKSNIAPAEDAATVAALTEACYRSAAERTMISLT